MLFIEGRGEGKKGWRRSESGNGRRALVKNNTMKRYAYGTKINVDTRHHRRNREHRKKTLS